MILFKKKSLTVPKWGNVNQWVFCFWIPKEPLLCCPDNAILWNGYCDNWIVHLEDPGVHDFFDGRWIVQVLLYHHLLR